MAQPLKYNLAGQRFGRLLVLGRVPGNRWSCRCECGVEREVYSGSLRSGRTQSCGCLNVEAAHGKGEDLTGRRVGRWTVLTRAMTKGAWQCRCDCGTERELTQRTLKKSESLSCGCLKAEVAGARLRKHGLTKTRMHRIWSNMKQRCLNPNYPRYADYGGRGIDVCEEWQRSFERFCSDVGEPPTQRHTIDRMDNDRGYHPGNVRWATYAEQNRNKRQRR